MLCFLVTETVGCLVSESELAWFILCTALVTEIVACLVSSESVLALFLISITLVTLWSVLLQDVSWPGF